MESNRKDSFVFKQPRSFEERAKLARILPERMKYRMPLAIDPMDAPADKAYAAWPERIYVMGVGGRIEYKAEPGPFGFDPEKAGETLKRLVAGG